MCETMTTCCQMLLEMQDVWEVTWKGIGMYTTQNFKLNYEHTLGFGEDLMLPSGASVGKSNHCGSDT